MGRGAATILAIETSGAAGSVALLRGGETLAERRFEPGVRGGNLLHPGVVAVLEAAGSAGPDLVAAGIGAFLMYNGFTLQFVIGFLEH